MTEHGSPKIESRLANACGSGAMNMSEKGPRPTGARESPYRLLQS